MPRSTPRSPARPPRLAQATAQLARSRGHLAAGDPVARAEQILAILRRALDQIDPLLATAGELGERIEIRLHHAKVLIAATN